MASLKKFVALIVVALFFELHKLLLSVIQYAKRQFAWSACTFQRFFCNHVLHVSVAVVYVFDLVYGQPSRAPPMNILSSTDRQCVNGAHRQTEWTGHAEGGRRTAHGENERGSRADPTALHLRP